MKKKHVHLLRLHPSGHPRFFLGTDSAPHPRHSKENAASCAGVFTSPYVLPYLATILESFGALHQLESFACQNGRQFYNITTTPSSSSRKMITLQKVNANNSQIKVQNEFSYTDSEGNQRGVVPFWSGKPLNWIISS